MCVCVCLQCHLRAVPAAAPLAAPLLFLAASSDGGEDAADAAAQPVDTHARPSHTVFRLFAFQLLFSFLGQNVLRDRSESYSERKRSIFDETGFRLLF